MKLPRPEDFDIRGYLTDRGIPFRISGKNVTKGWVEINHLSVVCGDKSFHLGISPQRGFHCWKCGAKGSLFDLIRIIENGSTNTEILKTITNYSYISQNECYDDPPRSWSVSKGGPGILKLPGEADYNFGPASIDYLTRRGYDPDYVIWKYQLMVTHNTDLDYRFRIIIPIIVNGQVVSFIGRDYTGRQEPKYKLAKDDNSITPPKQCLYNIDNASGDRVVVMEGVLDVWRFGDGAVATLSDQWTRAQAVALTKFQKVYVMYDGEPRAIEQADRLARFLSGVVPVVQVLELPSGDPDDLTDQQVAELRSELGF